MSTEKDREAMTTRQDKNYIGQVVAEWRKDPNATKEECLALEHGLEKGIQHARQGEREMLKRFLGKVIDAARDIMNGRPPVADLTIIDEFLEQEKSK